MAPVSVRFGHKVLYPYIGSPKAAIFIFGRVKMGKLAVPAASKARILVLGVDQPSLQYCTIFILDEVDAITYT